MKWPLISLNTSTLAIQPHIAARDRVADGDYFFSLETFTNAAFQGPKRPNEVIVLGKT